MKVPQGPEEKGNETILWKRPRSEIIFTVTQKCKLTVHTENTQTDE